MDKEVEAEFKKLREEIRKLKDEIKREIKNEIARDSEKNRVNEK